MEDNDDLIPVLRDSNPLALEGQGDYFLADLIQAQDETTASSWACTRMSNGHASHKFDVNVNLIRKV